MYFPEETNNFEFEDLVLFNVEVNDTYNARVLGQTKDYCFDEACTLPPVMGSQLFHFFLHISINIFNFLIFKNILCIYITIINLLLTFYFTFIIITL